MDLTPLLLGVGTLAAVGIGFAEHFRLKARQDNEYERKKAMYPPIKDEILFKEPPIGSICFGKDRKTGKYVCKQAEAPGSVLISGGSGCGKSTTQIIPFLLNAKGSVNSLIVDIKHELTDLTVIPTDDPGRGEDGTIIFDPLNRRTFGYDPLAGLSEDSSAQQVFETMQLISISVIAKSSGDKNAFWTDQAAKMLRGLLCFLFKMKRLRTLPDMIEAILGKPIKETLEEVMAEATPSSTEYMDLVDYYGMADETLFSVYTNLALKIGVFRNDADLAYCLGVNPRRFRPKDLLEHSVMLCIPEHKLQQYGGLVFMIVNQTLQWIMGLPEKKDAPDRKPIGVVIDETVALLQGVGGELAMLPQALRVVRSKGAFIVVSIQSISGLRCVMSKETVDDLLSNLPYKVFLDCTTPDDQKMICAWGGKFRRRKRSSTTGSRESVSLSFESEDILRPEDLMTLGGSGEAILISSISGYSRVVKAPCYQDKFFKPLLDEVANQRGKQI